MIDERTARMALAALLPLGSWELTRLVDEQGAAEVWDTCAELGDGSRWGRRASAIDPELILRATRECGSRFLVPGDPEWPDSLRDLDRLRGRSDGGPPLGLWVRGVLEVGDLPQAVSVVGARAATSYGSHVATEMAADIGGQGGVVISGLAYGIDAAAHRGALLAAGPTLAVLAGGVDRPYPASHHDLYHAVLRGGCVVSEAPPGAHPTKAAFLSRNRLIAALGRGVVVVEAAARSGARNTAAWANEMGRPVMAVPGPVTSALSTTPHRLIREGAATLVSSAAEVMGLLGPLDPQQELPLRGDERRFDQLRPELREIREVFQPREELTAGEISARTGQTVVACLAGADELSESGWLEQAAPQTWRLPTRQPARAALRP